ncbi:MAG: hypothetical protein K2L71_01845, partial [Muribaculaceae bacterium]|nr:hypothetical protein [Muribaculaceae bacterium]
MNKFFSYIVAILAAVAAAACGPKSVSPDVMSPEAPAMNPDYAGVTFPPNIAAPSFNIEPDFAAAEFQTEVGRCGQTPEIIVRSSEPAVELPLKKWRGLLGRSVGDSIYFR